MRETSLVGFTAVAGLHIHDSGSYISIFSTHSAGDNFNRTKRVGAQVKSESGSSQRVLRRNTVYHVSGFISTAAFDVQPGRIFYHTGLQPYGILYFLDRSCFNIRA